MRSVLVYSLLVGLKLLSRMFYRLDLQWVGEVPPNPWDEIRLVVFLNHTSLFEVLFLGAPPNRFLWRMARRGVIPAADKTTQRPLVGMIFRFVAHEVIPITRVRDNSWFEVLRSIDPDSMVIIAPEGRMMRADGLDAQGQPMTVRGGVSDILESIDGGRMLLAFSGGLHHVQIPGGMPRVFETIRLRVEDVDLAAYREDLVRRFGPEGFKQAVKDDLEARRDQHCPRE